MTTEIPSPPRRRRLRYFLITLATFAVTVALFYAEEDLRGWLAMDKTRHELQAQGVNLNWNSYLPAPVPEDENVFGVPEMQEGFTGHGEHELTKKWSARPNKPARMIVAQLTIGLPGSTPPSGSAVLQWGDSKAKEETIRLIKEAVGPVAIDPGYPFYTKKSPGEIRPAQIFLQCQTQPDAKDVLGFVPDSIFNPGDSSEKVKVENTGNGSYNVTMHTPSTAAEYLKWSEQIEPTFAMIRKALQRPYARMNGDYSEPSFIPIPAFVTIRNVAQRLGAMAQCHLMLGQPEEALRDLTLTHDICRRTLEENQPMTLVSGMINVAVRGLDAGIIADGLKMHAWREPQLAALEEQLKPINLLGPVQQAFGLERVLLWHHLVTKTPAELNKLYHLSELISSSGGYTTSPHRYYSFWKELTDRWVPNVQNWIHSSVWRSIPRGWAYQNVVNGNKLYTNTVLCLDPARQLVFPDKANASHKQSDAVFSHWSPYTFLASMMVPNFVRAAQTTAKNQTMINQARIACALERYHLAHGEYPETLDALIPQFIDAIPHDLVGGQPPHYRRNADGTFLLYSIGWSQQDRGGHASKSTQWDKEDGDWVWPPQF